MHQFDCLLHSLPSRTPQAPCQHNFCLECFGKWAAKGNKACPTCRAKLPPGFMANPRINTALTIAIRMARQGDRPTKAEVRPPRTLNPITYIYCK